MATGKHASGYGNNEMANRVPPYSSRTALPYGPDEYRREISRVKRSRTIRIVLIVVLILLVVAAVAAVTLFGVRLPF